MAGSKWFSFGLASFTLLSSSLFGQAQVVGLAPPQSHSIPTSQLAATDWPFALDGRTDKSVQIISESAMPAADKDLLARSEPELVRQTHLLAVEYNPSSWSYSEVSCHGFPNHLFLRFERHGAGEMSAFAASIPRVGSGRIRVIPIARRGYEPFTPAFRSALTIADFNRIRAEEPNGGKPYWVDLGLCYVALAGSVDDDSTGTNLILRSTPVLSLSSGQAAMHFITGQHRHREWELLFDRRANLLKVTTHQK